MPINWEQFSGSLYFSLFLYRRLGQRRSRSAISRENFSLLRKKKRLDLVAANVRLRHGSIRRHGHSRFKQPRFFLHERILGARDGAGAYASNDVDDEDEVVAQVGEDEEVAEKVQTRSQDCHDVQTWTWRLAVDLLVLTIKTRSLF